MQRRLRVVVPAARRGCGSDAVAGEIVDPSRALSDRATLRCVRGPCGPSTRSQSAADYSNDADNIATRAIKLLDKTEAGHRPIRLLGVSAHNFDRDRETEEEDSEARLPFTD